VHLRPPGLRVALDNGCGRWLEIWNLVFMQFDQAPTAPGPRCPAGGRHRDGPRAIVSVIQGVPSNYETDLFLPLFSTSRRSSSTPTRTEAARSGLPRAGRPRRAMTFLVADGVVPDNEGGGTFCG